MYSLAFSLLSRAKREFPAIRGVCVPRERVVSLECLRIVLHFIRSPRESNHSAAGERASAGRAPRMTRCEETKLTVKFAAALRESDQFIFLISFASFFLPLFIILAHDRFAVDLLFVESQQFVPGSANDVSVTDFRAPSRFFFFFVGNVVFIFFEEQTGRSVAAGKINETIRNIKVCNGHGEVWPRVNNGSRMYGRRRIIGVSGTAPPARARVFYFLSRLHQAKKFCGFGRRGWGAGRAATSFIKC